ncbi:hypothetical protein TNCV_2559721 [Trichonephila clavipes]|nr:hypothetical protein TNCV_2559721 [Trichonephila clavipes]
MGRQVAGRNYPPTNKNTLIRALTEEWDKLPQQLLDNVVQSMLTRQYMMSRDSKFTPPLSHFLVPEDGWSIKEHCSSRNSLSTIYKIQVWISGWLLHNLNTLQSRDNHRSTNPYKLHANCSTPQNYQGASPKDVQLSLHPFNTTPV